MFGIIGTTVPNERLCRVASEVSSFEQALESLVRECQAQADAPLRQVVISFVGDSEAGVMVEYNDDTAPVALPLSL